VWSIDRLGRSTATVTAALEELNHVGVAIYADKEGMDATAPHGRAMLQMAAVFGELERGLLRERVNAGLARARAAGKILGRPKIRESIEQDIRKRLATGAGILKVAKELGVGVGTVHRIKRELV
jgi:DNA invertase Pin-like site-specific DNA recombinase